LFPLIENDNRFRSAKVKVTRLGSTDTMVSVCVAGKNCVIPCHTRAVSDFSLLSCVTACCVVERFDLTIIKAAYYYHY